MTSNSVTPETVSAPAKPESFRSHLPAIAAATAGTVLATALGSLIGVAGTLVGIVVGSLLSGTISWWAERGLRRSAAVATARAEAIRARGRPLHPDEDAAVAQDAAVAEDAAVAQEAAASPGRSRRHRRWAGPAAFVVAAFIGCAVPLTLLEHAAGKPLSAVVQGEPGHGTTLGGGVSGARASHSPSPSPPARTTGPTTAPASSTAPAGASSSPAVSATTPATTSSTAPSATPTATASPSATPTPAATASAAASPSPG